MALAAACIAAGAAATADGSGTRGAAMAAPARNPFAGARWFVDPQSNARRQVLAWRQTRGEDAAQLEKIARRPQADWFGDWSRDVSAAVARRVATIAAARALAVFVIYDIPGRDCGSYSGGGAASVDAYRRWIADFIRGLGRSKAVIVLEPDALAELDCLDSARRLARFALLRTAVAEFATRPRASVYIDAGTAGWHPASVMAARLRAAGIARARGFALNVSNFKSTADVVAYGNAISRRLHGKHFIVDTSRNGLGPLPRAEWKTPEDGWCNPPGRALGRAASTATGSSAADAFFWIKRPGESDGTCNGGPEAGTWWPEYALGLARRART